nr:receptor-like protein 49 [Ziziphus jujuba var. spinosa]
MKPSYATNASYLCANSSFNVVDQGPIPQRNQFATFESSSYDGNLGLCGYPLEIECRNSKAPTLPPPASEEKGDSGLSFEFVRTTILPGYVSGLVVGFVAGYILLVKKQFCFMKILHQWKMKRRSSVRRRRRNRGFRG